MKILFLDIETSPIMAYVWSKYIEGSVIQVAKEWEILCVSYKFLGDKKVTTVDMKNQPSDKHVVKAVHDVLSKADVVVAHNGDQFDLKKLKARFIYHGLPPSKNLPSVDTKKAAKRYFGFTSNSLADLGVYLKLGKKAKHSGFDTWLGCMANKPKSWREMILYNKQDVVLLEKVYTKLLPWIEDHPNTSLMKDGIYGCNKCGSKDLNKWGLRPSASGIRQRWMCRKCGGYVLTSLSKKVGK